MELLQVGKHCLGTQKYRILIYLVVCSVGLALNQGQDSPTPKLCYLSFQLVTFLEEKTGIVELGESQSSTLKEMKIKMLVIKNDSFIFVTSQSNTKNHR